MSTIFCFLNISRWSKYFHSRRHCGSVYNWLSYRVIHDGIACYAHFHDAVFRFLFRNSVVLAVYLLFSVACFFTAHEHWCKDSRKTLFLRFLCTKSLALFEAPTPWAWCKDSRKTLFFRFLCTKFLALFGASTPWTWCKDSRKTLFLRFSCTKSPAQDESPPLLTW